MDQRSGGCVLLADRHHGLTEGVRGLLETSFDTVVMVADERSLFETAPRLRPTLVIVDLSLVRSDGLDWLQALKMQIPNAKLIVLSVHDEPSVCRSVLEAGAHGFVLKRNLVTELVRAVDVVRAGQCYAPPGLCAGKNETDRPPFDAGLKRSKTN
jgi:DNA-binding NarL/FixJ family response regulator